MCLRVKMNEIGVCKDEYRDKRYWKIFVLMSVYKNDDPRHFYLAMVSAINQDCSGRWNNSYCRFDSWSIDMYARSWVEESVEKRVT